MSVDELIWGLVVGGLIIIPLVGIVDAAVRSDALWRAADQSKVTWVVVQVFLGAIGSLIYFIIVRPKLRSPNRIGP